MPVSNHSPWGNPRPIKLWQTTCSTRSAEEKGLRGDVQTIHLPGRGESWLNIVPVEVTLGALAMRLAHPRLTALQADDTLYTVLALQPEGRIRITDTSIGHADAAGAAEKVRAFFDLASGMESKPDLVICPEYSVPWEVLLQLIESGAGPQAGKLWVLGCESLPLGQLAAYRERLGGKAIVIDEGEAGAVITTQRYRDPLVYLFRTQSGLDGTERLVMLVQYKTEASGDAGNSEARGMLSGNAVYLFGTLPGEVRLMTLICSDVFGLTDDQINAYYDGLLLLHVQLNNDPRHVLYKQYRPRLFAYGDRTELFCLNWAAGVVSVSADGEAEHGWNNIGGSAWYLRPHGFDCSDAHVAGNHKHGLYYTRYEPVRVHALQFHYAPRAFHLEVTKVFHHAVAKPKTHLVGPHALGTFHWSHDLKQWRPPSAADEEPADGFNDLLARVGNGVDLADLAGVYGTGPVHVERVLAISAGEFGPSESWYEAPNIDSMRLCQHEIVRRVTVTLDPEGAAFRSNRIAAARTLAALRAEGHLWPTEVEFMRAGFRLRWSQAFPHRNVEARNGTLATVIYAGQLGDPAHLERVDQRARQTLAGRIPEPSTDLSAEEWREHRKQHYAKVARLCIVYSSGAAVKVYGSPISAAIASPAGASPVDISVPAPRHVADGAQEGNP